MMLRTLLHLPLDMLVHAVGALPTRLGVFLRRTLYRPFLAESGPFDMEQGVIIQGFGNLSLGAGTHVERNCTLLCGSGSLRLGARCYLNQNVRVGSSGGEVRIGDEVMVGPNVVIDPSTHTRSRTDVPMKAQPLLHGRIVIGDDVWLGANCVVLRGVTIGGGCIVGAGAVVTRDLPPGTIAAGVPARAIGTRDAENQKP
jgi:galactoside O-acetyltransferase